MSVKWAVLICLSLEAVMAGCSPKNQNEIGAQMNGASVELNIDSETPVAACATEDMLREANASEADIRKFREDEAKLKAESDRVQTCG